ncbi:MAG: hypothetical protein NVSMB38_01560 [Ktedonobacteraceae bacterium]
MQNAVLAFTSPPQRGQVSIVFITGAIVGCTGVPHCGQNFFPVTSLPQDAQVVIYLFLPFVYRKNLSQLYYTVIIN